MTQVTVGKRGNDLAVRLPGDIVRATRLRDGERVEVETRDAGVAIRRAGPGVVPEEPFRGGTPEGWRAAHAGACGWGPDLGREVVAE